MPKKNRKKGKMDSDGASGSSAIDLPDDAMSTTSQCGSDSEQSVDPFAEIGDEDVDESSAQEIFEGKLKEAIDGILEKSLKGRMNSIKSVCNAMRKRVITSFLMERHVTVADALERSLKKGKGEEQQHAATALMLLSVQLGLTDEGEELFQSIKSTLISILTDPAASPLARAQCAEALGLCGFISAHDPEIVAGLMSQLESIFVKSYLKGDKTAPTLNPQSYNLHRAALESWSLLISISTAASVKLLVDKHLRRLPELLESPDLDVRIAGGEAISLLYELAREQDEDFEGPDMSALCEKLKQMSTDNNKHATKKSRKQQRSSFRDILHGIEDDSFNDFETKFGSEVVYIDSWTRKRQYDSLCATLATGMNIHLKENPLLRDVFGLGAPIPTGLPSNKLSKNDRRLYNQAMFKARTQVRQKLRDKRMAKISG